MLNLLPEDGYMRAVENKVVDRFSESAAMTIRCWVDSHSVERLSSREYTVNYFPVRVAKFVRCKWRISGFPAVFVKGRSRD